MSSEEPDAAVTTAITHLQAAEDALAGSSLQAGDGLRSLVGMVRLFVEMESSGGFEQIRELVTELENYE